MKYRIEKDTLGEVEVPARRSVFLLLFKKKRDGAVAVSFFCFCGAERERQPPARPFRARPVHATL